MDIFLLLSGALLILLVWIASIGFVYWDVYRRDLHGRQPLAWLAVVALLPVVGFVIYLFARFLLPVFSRNRRAKAGLKKRFTQPMHLPQQEVYLPTIAMEAGVAQAGERRGAVGTQPAARPVYAFTLIAGPSAGREFVVQSLPACIGRSPEAQIRLEGDRTASRMHAEIYEQAGALFLRDLDSTHGTQINGNWIGDQRLYPGDEIRIGVSILNFEGVK
jgi:hypothetical protein